MNVIWLCIMSGLSITAVSADQNTDTSYIRVFPPTSRIAGVFQASYVDHRNQPQYAFNASEARELCSTLEVSIASKAQVQRALRWGLETCRFGWIDEHLAVIPRIKALSNCGKNQTGLVTWRASVTQKFDVFCFNKSDSTAQLTDPTTVLPTESAYSTSPSSPDTVTSSFTTPPSFLKEADSEPEPARFASAAQGSRAKVLLITSTCAILLIAVVILAYIKLKRSTGKSDMKQQEEYMETEERTCVTNKKEPKKTAREDETIEIHDSEN